MKSVLPQRTQSYVRPADWKHVAPGNASTQMKLPKLPVPALPDTLAKLSDSLKPIAWTPEEFAAVQSKIEQFGKPGGIGEVLQQRLKEREATTEHWLEEWWDDGGYLGYRDSVVINVSYYYGFDAHPSHLPQRPAARAAAIARGAMLFRQLLKTGQLKPEGTKEGPFCMDTYRWMFDCCRIPGPKGLDWSVTYANPEDDGTTGHIIVFRHNKPWKVTVTDNGRILSTEEIERQIQHIYDNTTSLGPGVGVLPASNRDVWAEDFLDLSSSINNIDIVQDIHSAAFTISLDSAAPSNAVDHSRFLWHGHMEGNRPAGLQNRWVDKPVQFIVYDNMYAGIMGEHSIMDGTPTARMCDDVLNWIADPKWDHGTPSGASYTPKAMEWEMTPVIINAIDKANGAARKLIQDQELSYYLTAYGKAAIKKFGVSPDSWAQMLIQLAYRRLIGDAQRTGGTYEAATTRKFWKGRTEAIRVVTKESDAFIAAMDDPSKTKDERKALLAAAAKKHIGLAKAAGSGQGIDRHIYGLKKLVQEGEDAPELFSDPVLARSTNWVLSTSAVFSAHFPVYGWGEVVPDGFGVAYMTGYDDRLQFTVTSRTEMPNKKFVEELARAADDLYALFDSPISKL
ncbi:acyltransferase ChoActase/COT/CPT [Cylindrobasidium torrendii FP15055 ss-10]|uniref:Acyltransferase ChoActase/COT/CPT n=1 Tax=Cylindrobasidium torrendii FP15055 ss-10 TaxID=1314674 RepID=A0A0D7BNY0_9AGAR|nr:acyltransferase ChoActase/COT/CPT [Cylindrobasidium torrendii FP15055 ss-10]